MYGAAGSTPYAGCSTPEGIEAGSSRVGGGAVAEHLAVLNARRHRSGIEIDFGEYIRGLPRCSTPEGIEAGSRCVPILPAFLNGLVLNARRHRSGIEALSRKRLADLAQDVLNARRHRSGIEAKIGEALTTTAVLNARRHRSGISAARDAARTGNPLCSTPEGIEAGSERSTARKSPR